MKTVLNLVLFFIAFEMGAQDTIYFRNNSVVAAKISEIGVEEIKYKRFDNPEGPSYINAKSEITKIKYSNGAIDTITYVSSKADVAIADTASHKNDLRLIGTKLYYGNQAVGQMKARFLLKNKVLSPNQASAIKETISMKRKQHTYNALGTGLFVTGFAVPAVVSIGVLFEDNADANKNAVNEIVACAITGALFRIAGHVVVKITKNKSKARQLAFLKKYGQNEPIY